MTKSHLLPIFKCQYFVKILRYGSNFLHVIITFIGFKITFSNIRYPGTPLLISRGWRLAPPPQTFDPPKYVGFKRVNPSFPLCDNSNTWQNPKRKKSLSLKRVKTCKRLWSEDREKPRKFCYIKLCWINLPSLVGHNYTVYKAIRICQVSSNSSFITTLLWFWPLYYLRTSENYGTVLVVAVVLVFVSELGRPFILTLDCNGCIYRGIV